MYATRHANFTKTRRFFYSDNFRFHFHSSEPKTRFESPYFLVYGANVYSFCVPFSGFIVPLISARDLGPGTDVTLGQIPCSPPKQMEEASSREPGIFNLVKHLGNSKVYKRRFQGPSRRRSYVLITPGTGYIYSRPTL